MIVEVDGTDRKCLIDDWVVEQIEEHLFLKRTERGRKLAKTFKFVQGGGFKLCQKNQKECKHNKRGAQGDPLLAVPDFPSNQKLCRYIFHVCADNFDKYPFPKYSIEHKNGDYFDNRLCNLAVVLNTANKSIGARAQNNKLGVTGAGYKVRKTGEMVYRNWQFGNPLTSYAIEGDCKYTQWKKGKPPVNTIIPAKEAPPPKRKAKTGLKPKKKLTCRQVFQYRLNLTKKRIQHEDFDSFVLDAEKKTIVKDKALKRSETCC